MEFTNQNSNTLLLKCINCGKPFFTQGEKNFYDEKGLIIPTRCKTCREIRKHTKEDSNRQPKLDPDIKKVYNEIINNWSVEAKKENQAYFYYIQEVNDITSGKKAFVIGRKGSGKTAIAQYMHEVHDAKIFSTKLSFKNFPFNILYALENSKEYAAPNQYITIWKYVIYSYLCKNMVTNSNIDHDIKEKLAKLYGDSTTSSLNKLIERWTSTSFGLEVLGIGFNYGRERKKSDVTWIEIVDILEQVIMDYCDDSSYFFLFDELDEDYKDFTSDSESRNYKCMLTSLFKAVQDIRNTFTIVDKKVFPVVFLRSDIYSQIKDSDKNKWRESIIDLEWNTSKIKKMLAHRLSVAMNREDISFDQIWYSVFSKKNVNMGNKRLRQMDIFSYIERSTEMRPRDFVQYIIECVTIADERSEFPISPKTIRDADDNFSEYLMGETIDELFPVLPEIDEILGLFSTIRKQSFSLTTFEKEYNKLVERNVAPSRDLRSILLLLFDAGVIGNQPSMRGQSIFRFSKKSPRFNFNENMIIHRGLYKALQIF